MANKQFNSVDGYSVANAISVIDSTGNIVANNLTANGNSNVANLTANGNVSANYFIGNGSLLTGIVASAGAAITNGNSNVTVDANSNVRTSVAGNANILVVTGTGANISGYLDVTGNITGATLIGSFANGNSNVNIPTSNGNIIVSVTGTSNIAQFTPNGISLTGTLTANAASQVSASPAIISNTLTLDLKAASVFDVSLNNNINTLTISNIASSGTTSSFVLQFTADGTPRTVSWPVSFRWPNGTAPTLTSTLNKVDVIVAYTEDAGTNWFAFISGQNL